MNGVSTTTIAGGEEAKRPGVRSARRRTVATKGARFLGTLAGLYLLFAGLSANAQTAVGTVAVGQLPSAVVVSPVTNMTYVTDSGNGSVTAINNLTNSTTTISVGSNPVAVAVNPATNVVYVANSGSNSVSVIYGSSSVVANTINVGVAPDAIAVNMLTNQIYVANKTSGTVSVIDGNNVNPVSTVTVGSNPVALAVNPITNKVYVANNGGGNVTIINAASNNATQNVTTAANPFAVGVNPVTNEAYVVNQSGTVSVIGSSNTVIATVPVGTTPSGVAVNPVTNKIYVANAGSGNITTIDGATNGTANIASGTNPFAVAVNASTNEVFVTNNGSSGANSVTVFSGATGGTATTLLAQINAGSSTGALAVNPITNRAYVANYGTSGTVTVIDGSTYATVLQSGGTAPYAVAVNPVTNQIYVSDTGDGVHNSALTVIDGPSGNVVASVPVGANPVGIAVNSLTNKIYVVNQGSGVVAGNVTIINGSNNSPTTVTVGNGPDAIGVNPATNEIYVANYVDGTVSVISGTTNAVTATVGVAPHPQALAVNSASNEVYVATASGAVAIINGAGVATQVNAGNDPYAVAVNPSNNRAYVANYGDGTVTAIDGNNGNATTTIPVGSGPIGVAVNPVTNRVYVANQQSSSVTVIDVNNGNATSSVPAGTAPWSVTVNPATNRIYVPNAGSNNVTEIDGASNAPTTIPTGGQPQYAAVNPVTNQIYTANIAGNNVTIVTEAKTQIVAIITTISPLPGNIATSVTPVLSFSTSNSLTNNAPVINVFYQVDSLSGAWSAAQYSGIFSATTALAPGFHIVYAYSTDGEVSTSTAPTPGASPLTGSVSAYGFTVQPAGVTVSPTSLTFPNQQATTSGSPQTITLTNGGGQPLQFSFAYSDITEFPESPSDSCTAAGGQLPVGGSCTISITFAPQLPPGPKSATLTITDNANGVPGSQQTVTLSGTALGNVSPGLTWSTPAPIAYGAALTATQLSATTNVNGTAVPGAFVYTPPVGTVLTAGSQKLSVTFTPTDTLTYATTTTTVQLTVNKAPLTVAAGNVIAPYNTTPVYTATYTGFVNNDTSAVVSGTPAFSTNATTNPIAAGIYTITPAAGTLTATNYAFTNFTTGTLTVVQVPTVTVTSNQAGNVPLYGTTVTLTSTVTANSGTPTGTVSFYDAVTGATCTSLSSSLLLGTQALSGTTAVLNTTGIMAGTQTILACYNGDANNHTAGGSTTQSMAQGVPVVTWATPAAVNYGTALSTIQLDGTSTAMGTFVYSPPAGTVVGAGTQTLSVTFTPQDPIDYKTVIATVQLVVNQAPANSVATVTAVLTAGTSPKAVAVNPVTNKTYIVNNSSNSVTIYDGSSNTSSTVAVGNQPDAVAVNALTNQVYVANYADGTVSIIDGTTNLVSGPITVGSDPTVLAVNPATNRIYVVNQGSNSVTMINAAFSNTTSPITVGTNPYAVAVNPVTNKIYVSNQGPGGVGGNISVIDGATDTVTTVTDPAASGPYSVAVNPVTNTVFVTNLASKTVSVINGATNAVASVSVGTSPWAVDVNPVTNKAYVANYGSGTVTVINAASGNATSTVTVGTDPDAVAVNPVTNQVYVANLGSGNFTVIDGSSNTPTNVTAGTGPVAIGVNPVTDRIYVANNGSGNVSIVDGATNTTSTIGTGSQPYAVAVNPVTGNIYVANYNDGTVTVIAGGTVATVPVGPFPLAVAVNPVTNKIYVVFQGSSTIKGNVSVIDGVSNTPTLITVGNGPNAIAVNPVTNQIFVTNYVDATVSVINGLDNSVVPVSVGVHPDAIAVNPVTNKIYAAAQVNSTAGIVTVIDGTQNPPVPTANVSIGDYPLAIAVNPVTNKIYVANSNLDHYPTPGTLTVIDGVSNTPTTINAGIEPFAVAINTITNQIYLANKDGNSIMVVNGATNTPTTISVGQNPFAIAVNPVTNKIYVPNAGPVSGSYYFSVIDGATNYVTTLSGGTQPVAAAVNPVSNQVFIANQFSNNLTALTEEQVQTIQIATTIHPLSGNSTNISSPAFTFTAVNNFTGAPVDNVLYQADTWEGRWTPATSLGSGNFSGSTVPLTAGYHILYAYATDGEEGTTTAAGLQSSPIMGNIVAYGFVVATTGGASGATLNPNTINFAGEPEKIPSPAQTATLSNGGNSPLTFSVSFSGTNASDFTETTDTCGPLSGTLPANSSCTINVIFTPTQKGVSESATLTVTDNSNGVAGSTQTIALSGIGTGNEKPTITWAPGAITYGTALTSGQLPTAAYQGTAVAGAYTYTPTLSSLGAGSQTVSVTFTPTDTTDYTSATQSFQITVSPAPLTIKANNVTWGYGATPAYTATYTGFVNGDTSSVLTGTPVFTTTATTTPIPVGTYTVTPAQGTLTAANYIFTNFATGTLVVTKATPTITWGTQGALPSITYPAALGTTLNATATVNGATVAGTFAYSSTSGAITPTTVLTAGSYTLTATFTVTDTTDYANTTATATLAVLLPTQATFAFTDTTTSGNWQGKYGADGYVMANVTPSLPAYATFSVSNQLNYTWNPSTTDPRALQIPGGTNRIASTWYNPTTFSFAVNLSDGNAHLFALYALDWDNSGRSETVQILNATTMQQLDSRTISNFQNGVYLVWNLSGNVIINVTNSGGNNAAMSAAFFGGTAGGAETVTVTPATPTLTAGQQQTFSTTISGTANTSQTDTWAITGVSPSTAPQGTINASTGVYTAPASGTIAAATVTITATDQDGVKGTTTATLNPGAVSGGNGATFITTDTTTSGSWVGKYGADGYSLANATPSVPNYATFSVTNQINYTWAPTTTDPRALQIPGGTGGFAATWYNPATFTFSVNFTDGLAHEFALYAVDWTNSGRAETVQIQDGVTGVPLDTRTLSNFSNGAYLVWNLSGNVKIVVTSTAGPNAVISGAFFGGTGTSGPETVTVAPANPTLTAAQQQTFTATIGGTANISQTVTWAIMAVNPSTAPQGTINASTGAYTAPSSATIAAATITITATDQDAVKGTTTVTLNPGAVSGGNGATFIKTDTTTSGSWQGKYGGDGYSIANVTPSVPTYASFGVQNQLNYTWAPSTSDARALAIPAGTGGIASTWYNSSTFSFTVNFTDGQTHQFALYALDWDNLGRSETIAIQDGVSGTPLDSRTVTNFGGGTYLVWNLSGNVKIVVTSNTSSNAVISGAFFGSGTSTSGPETVTVTPGSPTLTGGQQQTFAATIAGTTNTSQAVTWAITNVSPSTAPEGTINASTGAYTAPASGTIAAATVTIAATDQDAVKGTTAITLNPGAVSGGNGATFITMDTTTSGSWKGKYGADGYSLAGATASLPTYDQTFAPVNQINYTWAPTTSDPRGLQIPGSTGNFAATWYNPTTFSFNVNFTDGQAHEFALYAVDWTSSGRSETVQIQDGVSGVQLDSRTLTNFTNGTYLVWNISGNVKIVVTTTAGVNSVISGAFFGGSGTSGPETVTVTPANPTMTAGLQQTFTATIGGTANTSQTVTWAITGVTPSNAPQGTINASTGVYTAPSAGTIAAATVTVTATDQDSVEGTTTVTLNAGAVSGSNGATFIKTDTTTSGSWEGKYGSDGYSIANLTPSVPSYTSFGIQNQLPFTWVPSTSDARALEIPGGTGGIASTWYNSSTFSFTVSFTDGQTHQFALYALDWDSLGRSETIQIQDGVSGLPLDSRTVTNFSGGTYLVWNISGDVKIVVTSNNSGNAVISGAFFGGSGTSGPETVTVTPSNPTLTGGQQQTFAATIGGTANTSQTVTWGITGVSPSNAPQGTINASTGVYTAPASGTISSATVTITATDQDSVKGTTTITLTSGAVSGTNGATFIKLDTTTSGSWKGVYGSDGYMLANSGASLPSYDSGFGPFNQINFTWLPSTSDPRALQIPGGSISSVAAAWYNPASFSFPVNFTDGQTHQVALYALDWDASGRSETIQVLDGVTGLPLDTRTVSNFSNGTYVVWNISGNVTIVVTKTVGANAVISGAFFK